MNWNGLESITTRNSKMCNSHVTPDDETGNYEDIVPELDLEELEDIEHAIKELSTLPDELDDIGVDGSASLCRFPNVWKSIQTYTSRLNLVDGEFDLAILVSVVAMEWKQQEDVHVLPNSCDCLHNIKGSRKWCHHPSMNPITITSALKATMNSAELLSKQGKDSQSGLIVVEVFDDGHYVTVEFYGGTKIAGYKSS